MVTNPLRNPCSLLPCLLLAVLAPAQKDLTVPFEECTVGVASGRATADGRPLLWKNRDTSSRDNEVVYFDDGRFSYVALVNAGGTRSAWGGVNEAGFCIMNSVVSDQPGGSPNGVGNGGMMKLALQTCATIDDFERLLETSGESGRRTKANFGVIDATGGAAIFETSHKTYTKFDAQDEEVAPDGYIVRANFTMTGGGNAGRNRYERGCTLCETAMEQGGLDYRYLVRKFARDLADDEGAPYPIPVEEEAPGVPDSTINAMSTINRYSTTSAMIFHGVKPEENPALTTFWVLLGEPIFTSAVPCWVAANAIAPQLDGEPTSPLCSAVLDIVAAQYERRGRGQAFLNTANLPDIWSVLFPAEDRVFQQTDEIMARWRIDPPTSQEVLGFHETMAEQSMAAVLKVKEMVGSSQMDKRLQPNR